jgi:hypothetical protein
MSASVVFAREELVLFEVCIVVAGTLIAFDCGGGVGVAAIRGAAVGADTVEPEVGGADGALGVVDGGVPVTGLVELGLLVQASSSNPLAGSATELALAGGCTGAEGVAIVVVPVIWGVLGALDKALISTDGGKDLVG